MSVAQILLYRLSVELLDVKTMFQKMFRKPAEIRQRFEQDSTLAESLKQRVDAIDFQPSRGFLKDQWQQKRSPDMPFDEAIHMPGNAFVRQLTEQGSLR
jgi:hypothetical protein